VVLGATMAFLVVRTDMPYGRVFAKLGIVPRAFPVIIAALAWILLLSPRPEQGASRVRLETFVSSSVPSRNGAIRRDKVSRLLYPRRYPVVHEREDLSMVVVGAVDRAGFPRADEA